MPPSCNANIAAMGLKLPVQILNARSGHLGVVRNFELCGPLNLRLGSYTDLEALFVREFLHRRRTRQVRSVSSGFLTVTQRW